MDLRKRWIGFLMLMFFFTGLQAQQKVTVTGMVQDAETGEPISLVNVFIPFTTIGSVTDELGHFELRKVPVGEIELGFRHISYHPEKLLLTISAEDHPPLAVQLSKQVLEMEEIVKIAEEAPYKRALRLFREYFLGDLTERTIKIMNPEVLYFHYEGNKLIAQITEPLHIVNNRLGYELTYFLDYFEFYYDRGDLMNQEVQFYTCSGEALFSEIETENKRKEKRFEEERARLFSGSQRDFFRALYNQILEKEGYSVKLAWQEYGELEEFYKENGIELSDDPPIIDSVYDYLPGKNQPTTYYYLVFGENIPFKGIFMLEENAMVFKMYNHLLVFYNSWHDETNPGDPRMALVRLTNGFVTIDSTGQHNVQKGILEWKYLDSEMYLRNYLPQDYLPKNEEP